MLVFNSLCIANSKYTLNYVNCRSYLLRCTEKDWLYVTLIWLHLNRIYFELSQMFGISEVTVFKIVICWINFMFLQWHELNIWSSNKLIKINLLLQIDMMLFMPIVLWMYECSNVMCTWCCHWLLYGKNVKYLFADLGYTVFVHI
jgi:hypothetical protein